MEMILGGSESFATKRKISGEQEADNVGPMPAPKKMKKRKRLEHQKIFLLVFDVPKLVFLLPQTDQIVFLILYDLISLTFITLKISFNTNILILVLIAF